MSLSGHGAKVVMVFEQFVVSALGFQLAVVQHIDPVTLTHGTEAVGDHDDGLAVAEVVHRVHHRLLG